MLTIFVSIYLFPIFNRGAPADGAVKELKPTMLIGVSTITGAFSKEVVEAMAEINKRPIIFPLSNPTSKAECTYKEAFEWTKGKVVFASGSPFPSLKGPDGKLYHPAQANNAYISSISRVSLFVCELI